MINKIAIITLLILVVKFAAANESSSEFNGEIEWSEIFEKNEKQIDQLIIGQNGESYFLIRLFKNKKILEKYDLHTLKLISSKEFELKYMGEELEIAGVLLHYGRPALQSYFYKKKDKTTYAFIHFFDKSSLAIGEPKLVVQSKIPKSKGLMKLYSASLRSMYGLIRQSENKKFAFHIGRDYLDKKRGNEENFTDKFVLKFFNEEMDVLSENEIELPTNLLAMQNIIGNNGLNYVSGFKQNEKVDNNFLLSNKVMQDSILTIYIQNITTGESEQIEISFENKGIRNYKIHISDNNEIIVSGFTGNNSEDGIGGTYFGYGIGGAFYASFDSLLREKAANQVDFEDGFITPASDQEYYAIKNFLVKPDGTASLCAEQRYTTTSQSSYYDASLGKNKTVSTQSFHFEDIILLNFDKNGRISWKVIVEKTQRGYAHSSFYSFLKGSEVNLLYGDASSSFVKLVRIDENGVLLKEESFRLEADMKLVLSDCEMIDSETIFLHATSLKGDQLGRIKL